MKRLTRGLWLALLGVPLLAAAVELPSRRYQLPIDPAAQALQLPALNAEKALAEDALADKGAPLRYAIMHKTAVDVRDAGKQAVGRWTEVDADTALWRTRIDAPGALSIDLALRPFVLPEGAEVWLSDAAGARVRGPYTAADNPKSGEFWTPYVPGDVAYLEVLVPKARRDALRLGIQSVQQAYRSIESGASPFAKSGSCNVDVVCSEGNSYRDQINAVARYSVNGGLCTGQLVNNTAQDNRRYFITANHCLASQADANTVVLYWKYESPVCRAPNSTESGTPISTTGNSIVQTGGTVLRATHQPADTTLLEINTEVPAAAGAFWLGWDRSENAVASAVSIHHPQGHEKRISFENQALVVSDNTPSSVPGDKHWQITDWDLGTTEPGSSGSVLMNPQKRLIGVLSGGGAACGNNLPDYYGRLNVAWEGGGTADSRVRDWLDPGSTGTAAIDGKSSCVRPTVNLTLPATATAGAATVLSLQISGGIAPYTVTWDVDGDLVVDRRSTGVTGSTTLQPNYASPVDTTVSVDVTDASGCKTSVSQVLAVGGARLAASENGAAAQACGDGDAQIEPGEIWNFPVRLSNGGNQAMNDGFAVFVGGTVPGLGGGNGALADDFGYQALSSRSSSQCRYQAIDMSAATVLVPTEGPHVTTNPGAADEGFVAGLSVGGSAPFRFYGNDVTTLMMSTNGYLSTNVADGGDDWTPECGIDTHQGVVDGRIQALHDDLVIQSGGSLRHRHFDTCPRPSDVGAATQGCTVFEWRNMGQFTGSGSATGNAVFQSVLYDLSYDIVHQYVTATADNGASAVIGQQSPDEAVRFNYQCEVANAAPSGSALCFFHPTALPAGAADVPLHVLTPALDVGNLAAGAQVNATISAYVDPAAKCGDAASLNFLGGVDDVASSFQASKLQQLTLPSTGQCQVATQCTAQLPTLPALPAGGVYLNPNRSGNGQNIFNIGSVLSSIWFTGDIDRSPVWYLMAGPWSPNFALAKAELRKFTRTASTPFTVKSTAVGTSWFARGDDDSAYINVWHLDGRWGGEKQSRFYATTNLPTPNHTGGWRNSGESGWGVVIDEHALQGQASTGMLTYLYDSQDQPRWTLGEQFNSSNTIAHSLFQVHCPGCPRFADFGSLAQAVGTVTRSYQSQTAGTLDSTLTLPAPLGGTWNRAALPIQMITPPLSPSP